MTYTQIFIALAIVLVGRVSLTILWVAFRPEYTLILNLSNGQRKTLTATRFSVPTTQQINDIERATRTPDNPTGAFVYSWFRVKK